MKHLFRNYFIAVALILVIVMPLMDFFDARLEDLLWQHELDSFDQTTIKGLSLYVKTSQAGQPDPRKLVDALHKDLGLNVELLEAAEAAIDDSFRPALLGGAMVISSDGDYLYQKLEGSGQVIALELPDDPQPDQPIIFIYWGYSLVLVLVISLVLVLPFTRTLERIGRSATAFGEGRLDVRVRVAGHSPLKPLALAFNNMADRIEQLIRSHKDLTNAVSHELRTPLARMRFNLEMLLDSGAAAATERFGAELNKDIDEMNLLITELLTYARFDREQPSLALAHHDIKAWLEEVVAGQAFRSDKSIAIDCRLEAADAQVVFERRYLTHALNNLLHNAERYAAGAIRVSVERSGQDCLIHVDDDGPGIPAAERLRLLKPFERLDNSRSRDTGGFGLGLAIVSRILAWHAGSVNIASSCLGGARVSMRWPGYAVSSGGSHARS